MKICNNISCMKQILSTHNPKVVSSNLAPATKMKRTFKQVKKLGGKGTVTHLPECSFLLYPIS